MQVDGSTRLDPQPAHPSPHAVVNLELAGDTEEEKRPQDLANMSDLQKTRFMGGRHFDLSNAQVEQDHSSLYDDPILEEQEAALQAAADELQLVLGTPLGKPRLRPGQGSLYLSLNLKSLDKAVSKTLLSLY